MHRPSHFVQVPFDEAAQEISGAATCQQHEPACDPEWDYPSRAITMLVNTDDAGDGGVCTGTLLNDADPSTYLPYPLTAHHCLSEQTRASSVETFWSFQSPRCSTGRQGLQAVSGGADLRYDAKTTDTHFLRLGQPPPAGALFADWSATLPALGISVIGIQHPRDRAQEIAVGSLAAYWNCWNFNYCGASADPHALR